MRSFLNFYKQEYWSEIVPSLTLSLITPLYSPPKLGGGEGGLVDCLRIIFWIIHYSFWR